MTVPPKIRELIRSYADFGSPPGGFVKAVLENNLELAVFAADSDNLKHLKDIVMYCHWEIPSSCWGSPEKVQAWVKEKKDGYEKEEKEKEGPTNS